MLQLGPKAFEASTRLKSSDEWRTVTAALTDLMSRFMHAAVESGLPEHCGYARALRDVVWFFECVEAGPASAERATQKPAVASRVKELARV